MPDLEFSDLDLLPLPAAGDLSSPSLTDGGSFSGRSRSEIETPIKESGGGGGIALAFDVVGSGGRRQEGRGLERTRDLGVGEEVNGEEGGCKGRKPSHASLEVLNAWNALGGYTV